MLRAKQLLVNIHSLLASVWVITKISTVNVTRSFSFIYASPVHFVQSVHPSHKIFRKILNPQCSVVKMRFLEISTTERLGMNQCSTGVS